jgi:hypothetical protein
MEQKIIIDLTPSEVERLSETADFILPSEEGMPVASSVLRDGRLLHVALKARHEQASLVREVCAQLQSPSHELIGQMFSDTPTAMEAVANIIAGAYFMDADVRRSIGYPGQVKRPAGLEEAVDDLGDDLLDPVFDRGQLYRSVS